MNIMIGCVSLIFTVPRIYVEKKNFTYCLFINDLRLVIIYIYNSGENQVLVFQAMGLSRVKLI